MNLGCAQTVPIVIVTFGVVLLPSSYLFLRVQENGRHLVSMATDNKISTLRSFDTIHQCVRGTVGSLDCLGCKSTQENEGYSSHFLTECEHQPQNWLGQS